MKENYDGIAILLYDMEEAKCLSTASMYVALFNMCLFALCWEEYALYLYFLILSCDGVI
jgi:hypothetical protein